MSEDSLGELRRRVAALDHAALAEHPDVLDDVHRRLVDELDGLAGAGSAGARR